MALTYQWVYSRTGIDTEWQPAGSEAEALAALGGRPGHVARIIARDQPSDLRMGAALYHLLKDKTGAAPPLSQSAIDSLDAMIDAWAKEHMPPWADLTMDCQKAID